MNGVINYTEIWVKEELERILKNTDGCKCHQCKCEMMALALNHLRPNYCTSDMGEVMSKLEHTDYQEEATIIVEVTKAIKTVQNRPNHTPDKIER